MARHIATALALALAVTACVGVEDDEIGTETSTIRLDPKLKPIKVNDSISPWLRDLEAQLQLAPPRYKFEDPEITSLSPSTVQRGQQLTITGRNFSRMTWFGNQFAVSFQAGANRSLANATSMTATQIVVTVPANATTGRIRLVNTSRANALWAESILPLTVNVPVPTTGTARFTNDSQFEIHILTVNGMDMIAPNQVLPPGAALDVVGPGASVPFHAELGFGGFTMVTFDGSVNIVNGQTTNVSIRRFRAADAFTLGAPTATFEGDWTDSNFAQHTATMVFRANGSYDLYDDGTYLGTNSYGDGAFNVYSSIVNVTINNTTIGIDFPYSSFILNNGPPVWPLIEYVRQ